jgi:hypothetical protein
MRCGNGEKSSPGNGNHRARRQAALEDPYMCLTRFLAVGTAVAILTTPAAAGTMFRVEVGSPIALGITKHLKKTDAKKVVLAVRGVVCQDVSSVQITGTAEGVVAGKRRSLPLTLTPVEPAEAVYAIQQQWPPEGTWVLHLKGSCSNPKAEASTLAAFTNAAFIRDKSTVLREPATKKQVEDAVAALAHSQS